MSRLAHDVQALRDLAQGWREVSRRNRDDKDRDRWLAVSERWGALPLGELHAYGTCAYCGARAEIDWGLKRTVLAYTRAVAHVCVDVVGCERRRYRAKL